MAAILGPSYASSANHAMNVCDVKEIPYIDLRWDSQTSLPVINLHPHPDTLAEIFVDLIRANNWKSFTILYETSKQNLNLKITFYSFP